jgi:hypothetical protein
LNSHDKEFTLHEDDEIRKQNAPEEAAEKYQPEPEPKERNMTDLKCTDGLELTEADIKVSEDSNEQRAAKTRQEIMRVFPCYEDVLKGKEWSLSLQNSVLDFFKSPSTVRASPPVMLEGGVNEPVTRLTFHWCLFLRS